MSDRFLAKLAIGLAIVLLMFLFRVAAAFYRSPRISSKAKLLTTIGIFLALFGGFVVYPEEAAFHKAKREAASDPWAFVYFQNKYPASRHIAEVDDMMWQATYGPKADWALYLYKEHFRFGKHKDELKERLARKKQDELTEIRTHPDLKKAREFLSTYKNDPEAAEARDILFSVLERIQAGNKASPPPALFRKLIHSGEANKITYSIEVAENTDCPKSNGIRTVIGDRLRAAIEGFQLQPQGAADSGSIRARAGCVLERGATYGDGLAHGEVMAVQLALYFPGQLSPAWTGIVTARSPERISGLNKSNTAVRNQEVVTEKTVNELKESLKAAFRYW